MVDFFFFLVKADVISHKVSNSFSVVLASL